MEFVAAFRNDSQITASMLEFRRAESWTHFGFVPNYSSSEQM